ncbi:Zn-ribbon domain-containing OB-fold protein [Streptosporangium amethystogenes subsp. fukuiense]|uniref:Zn-ribbon domain-containing OB-fold protein n=1 Tax=Streptosporangium amethystogenes subsp. fukuiense TaxID=698418 RepID=A0ABW2TAN3_9ACTN
MSTPLAPQHGELPHAEPTELSAPFWNRCAEGTLTFQRCAACRSINFPPVEVCRECLDTDLGWEESSGRGTLYSWTVVHRPVTAAFTPPYAPAIVDLDEGYQMVTDLIGIAPEEITAGMPVEVDFHEVSPGLHLPYFRPRSG